jgi:hypothetical protein
MRRLVKILYVIFTISVIPAMAAARAQGNDATVGKAPENTARGSVQLGAGSTSNVTTGSSGPKQAPGNTAPPLDTNMPWPPVSGAFSMPGPLSLERRPILRCDVIADGNARLRCDQKRKQRDG